MLFRTSSSWGRRLRRPSQRKLRLEVLEDRLAPSASPVPVTIDPNQGLPTTFSIGGLKVANTSLHAHYNAATSELDLSGGASVTAAGNTLGVSFGSDTAPGLVVVNGDLQSLTASITSDVKVAGLTFHTEDLTLHYAPGDNVTIQGKASFSFRDHTLEVALGSPDGDGNPHPGIVIDPSTGNLVGLDAAITTDVTVAGLTFKAEGLGVHYAPGDNVTIKGKASFDLHNDKAKTDQSVAVDFGGPDLAGTMHPGIVIDPSTGKLLSLDAAITTDLTVAGLNIKAEGLGVEYDSITPSNPQERFTVFGGASFTLADHTVEVKLGGNFSPGLVIANGQLTSLEASVTTDIDLKGIQISAKGLTVAYVASDGTNPERFALFGQVSVTTKFLSFDTTLGTESNPGIDLVGGQLHGVNITVSGGFSLFGVSVAADGLTIQYSSDLNQLEISGGVKVELTDSIKASAKLSKGGLLIDTTTGALSLDTAHGLELMADVEFGPFAIHNLDIAYSNGAAGINFHASGEVDFPGGWAVGLTTLDIHNGVLTDIGLHFEGNIPIGDTGFFLNSLDGALHHLDNLSQLEVDAGAGISFGEKVTILGHSYALVAASGSISVSASELKLSGMVSIAGGILGDGAATLDLNWATGVYMVSVDRLGIYDDTIIFSGNIVITSQGDITLQARASVNVPSSLPFIGGYQLGEADVLLVVHATDPNEADSYFAAWTSFTVFTTFTVGFKVDFTGAISFLNGDDVANLQSMGTASMTQDSQQPALVDYPVSFSVPDQTAAGYLVTATSPAFAAASSTIPDAYFQVLQQTPSGPVPVASYAIDPNTNGLPAAQAGSALYTDQLDGSTPAPFGGSGLWSTSYQLSRPGVSLPSLSFTVSAGDTVLGTGTIDANQTLHFTPNGTPAVVPTYAGLNGNELLTLYWPQNPGATSVSATYSTLTDRVIYIDAKKDVVPGGYMGQYTVQLVTQGQLDPYYVPTFSETTRYLPPVVSFGFGSPYIAADGSLRGTIIANSFTPEAAQGGSMDTTVSLYITANGSTSGGTLIGTYDYNSFQGGDPNYPFISQTRPFRGQGFPTLPAGQYQLYAVINDGQSPPVTSALSAPVTALGPQPVLSGPAFLPLSAGGQGVFSAAAGTALGVQTSTNGPVSVELKVSGGSLLLSRGTATADFTQDYPSAAAATAALDGLQFQADATFSGSATLTFRVSTTIGGTLYTGVESIPLLTPNTHLVVTQSVSTANLDPDAVQVTVTVGNPGGPLGQEGTGVSVQEYLSQGLAVLSASASQGSYDPKTGMWSIGTLPIGVASVTLTLTLHADPGTFDKPLSAMADGGSDLFNYPAADAESVVPLVPASHTTVFAPAALPASSTVGAYYDYQLTADGGGGGPYTFALAGGSLPDGVHLTPDGMLIGVPKQAGDFTFSVTATSLSGSGATAQLQLSVSPAAVGFVGQAYSLTVGVPNYSSFFLLSGALPPGVTLDTSSGNAVLTGTPTAAGSYSFVIREQSFFFGAFTDHPFTVLVDQPITVAPATLPAATAGSAYNQVFTASGGGGSFLFGVFSGSLPPGLTVSPSGVLAGTVKPDTPAGTFTFTVSAYDANTLSGSTTVTLQVDPAITVGPQSLPAATKGTPYSVTLTATGGSGAGYTFAISSGSLPAGLTLSPGGTISGTPLMNVAAADFDFTVSVTDSTGAVATLDVGVLVDAAVKVGPTALPVAAAGAAYSQALTATGGSGTGYTFAVTSGSLPAGLSLSPAGTISGTLSSATPAGYYPFTLTATDSLGNTGQTVYALFVDASLVVNPPATTLVREGTPFSLALHASGGSSIYHFAVTGGALPQGLTLSDQGTISGTIPLMTRAGTYTLQVTATDSLGNTCPCPVVLNVDPVNDTWTGAVSTAWSNPGNWSSQSVPLAGDNVLIPSPSAGGLFPAVLDMDETVGSLTVQSGASLSLAGHALSVSGTLTSQGTLTAGGRLAVAGLTTLSGGTFLAGPAALAFIGGLTLSGGNFLGGSGAVSASCVTITAGKLTAPTGTLSDSGDWLVRGGAFVANRGTVVLTGKNQHVSGNNVFFNLSKTVTAADTLTFLAGSTQTVMGKLTLRGSKGQLLALRSSKPGTGWNLNAQSAAVSFVDLQDGHNLSRATLTATASRNSGRNSRWRFA